MDIICVPFDLCGPHQGSRMGSLAMRLEGLEEQLRNLRQESNVIEASKLSAELPGDRQTCDSKAIEVFMATKVAVTESLKSGSVPLVIGGDHSIAIGSISGALQEYGDDLGVLWIDAHMDLNTPITSPTGNLHGMPLAVLTHLEYGLDLQNKPEWFDTCVQSWAKLRNIVPERPLRKDRIAWFGLRSVDSGEVRNFQQLNGSLALTMQDIDQNGINDSLSKVKRWVVDSGCKYLWISFDVDVLDPVFAPGTGTAVRGGLTYREGHLIAETLHDWLFREGIDCQLAGLDLVEVNPLCDQGNTTARVANEWLCSLFGRRILGVDGR